MENRGGRMHSRVHTELYVHTMPFLSFFMATGIGQLPATIVYSYVGGMLTGGARFFVTGLMILFALSAFVVMVRKIYIEKQGKTRRKK